MDDFRITAQSWASSAMLMADWKILELFHSNYVSWHGAVRSKWSVTGKKETSTILILHMLNDALGLFAVHSIWALSLLDHLIAIYLETNSSHKLRSQSVLQAHVFLSICSLGRVSDSSCNLVNEHLNCIHFLQLFSCRKFWFEAEFLRYYVFMAMPSVLPRKTSTSEDFQKKKLEGKRCDWESQVRFMPNSLKFWKTSKLHCRGALSSISQMNLFEHLKNDLETRVFISLSSWSSAWFKWCLGFIVSCFCIFLLEGVRTFINIAGK